MALGEAMICGLPVVSTDCPTGPREILAPESAAGTHITAAEYSEYGVLMPLLKGDYRQHVRQVWVATLQKMLLDPELRAHYAAQAQKRMEDFTAEKIFQQWEQVIQKVAAQ